MDRRQRKTREAIFAAFIALLSKKDFTRITVSEIIGMADISRATFYSHFETKDDLLKALCDDLFCHVLDGANGNTAEHRHMFRCDTSDSVFLHLLRHLLRNDNHLLELLSCRNSDLFLRYFKEQLRDMVASQLPLFQDRKSEQLPDSFWIDHIASVFVETIRWWSEHGMKESPETVAEYFYLAV